MLALLKLAVSASAAVQWTYRMPDLASGDYPVWLVVRIDSRSSIPESDEADNTHKHASGVSVTGATILYNCIVDDDPHLWCN